MRRLWRCCRHRPDPFVAALLTAGAAIALAAQGQMGDFPGSACVLGFCALVALRRWRPVPVAVLAGVLIAIPDLAHDASTVYANATFISGWAAVFLYSYALGSDPPFPLSLLGIAAILVGVNLSEGGWNPRGGPTGRGRVRSAGRAAQRHLARSTGYRNTHRRGTDRPGPGLGPGHLVPAAWRGADAAYRMVQESITNAMKHAPGAPMEVTVRGSDDGVEIRVVNGPAGSSPSGLERAGGGHGLAGVSGLAHEGPMFSQLKGGVSANAA